MPMVIIGEEEAGSLFAGQVDGGEAGAAAETEAENEEAAEAAKSDADTKDGAAEAAPDGGTEKEIISGVGAADAEGDGTGTGQKTDGSAYATPENEIKGLRAEVEALRGQLDGQRKAFLRMSAEVAEFNELFPEQNLGALPPEVWEGVKRGIPLAAAYAYETARRERRAAIAAEANTKNSKSSAGPPGAPGGEGYFSPAEVRSMSASEVRSNYTTIMDSMKLWS